MGMWGLAARQFHGGKEEEEEDNNDNFSLLA